MKEQLEEPVEFGEVRLAPTVELAGLAEISAIHDQDEKLAAIVRIAHAVRSEDRARDHLRQLRDGTVELESLPKRR